MVAGIVPRAENTSCFMVGEEGVEGVGDAAVTLDTDGPGSSAWEGSLGADEPGSCAEEPSSGTEEHGTSSDSSDFNVTAENGTSSVTSFDSQP